MSLPCLLHAAAVILLAFLPGSSSWQPVRAIPGTAILLTSSLTLLFCKDVYVIYKVNIVQ